MFWGNIMKNPLSKDERLDVVRALGHDLMGTFGRISSEIQLVRDYGCVCENPDHLLTQHAHAQNVIKAVSFLAAPDRFVSIKASTQIKKTLAILEDVLLEPVGRSENFDTPLVTSLYPLYAAMYNLAKNAIDHNPKDTQVFVDVRLYEGDIPGKVFGLSPDTDSFIRFSVLDTGKGFDESRPLEEYLREAVSTKGAQRGFGLYFTSLVCKYLGAPLGIESCPGQTRVSIYHPMDLNGL